MNATLSQVRQVVIPPQFHATDSFQPVSHGEALDLIEANLDKAGLKVHNGIGQARFTLSDNDARMAATLPLDMNIDGESRMQVVVLNSFNKKYALRIGFGSQVFVCTNGCIFAQQVLGRKHTTHIMRDINEKIENALHKINEYAESQAKFFNRLRESEIDDVKANDLIVRSAKDYEIITSRQIVDVVEEWRKPRHVEFSPRNAWSLHNAITEISKKIASTNADSHANRMVNLSNLFTREFASDLALPVGSKFGNAGLN
jgi:hypothetical protein